MALKKERKKDIQIRHEGIEKKKNHFVYIFILNAFLRERVTIHSTILTLVHRALSHTNQKTIFLKRNKKFFL